MANLLHYGYSTFLLVLITKLFTYRKKRNLVYVKHSLYRNSLYRISCIEKLQTLYQNSFHLLLFLLCALQVLQALLECHLFESCETWQSHR